MLSHTQEYAARRLRNCFILILYSVIAQLRVGEYLLKKGQSVEIMHSSFYRYLLIPRYRILGSIIGMHRNLPPPNPHPTY